ncbi:MAG: phenylalanine--tRNA ligase beta subunit-related protein [Bacteroidota bacterium]
MTVSIGPYPSLAVACLRASYPEPLAEIDTPEAVSSLLALDADAPISRDEDVRLAVRDLLRARGYKPTGRGKPASEYLIKAAEGGFLGPINGAVDACNAVSLHSGLPISVVSLDRTEGPFRIASGEAGDAYVFNASGHEIKLDGLLCLWDASGPCANPVRDSQRTKTHEATRETLSVIWASEAHADRLTETAAWYASLLQDSGAEVERVLAA